LPLTDVVGIIILPPLCMSWTGFSEVVKVGVGLIGCGDDFGEVLREASNGDVDD